MQRRSAESLAFATRAGVRGVSTGRRAGISWWRCGPIQRAIRLAAADVFESCGRVARKTHVPTRKGILEFFGNQVLINAVAWTAGVIAAGLVKSFFEVKGFRNLWGLIAPRGRALVSADDYQMIMTLMSYSAGLLMLILVRHLILRLITEFRALRLERARWREGSTRTHLYHDLPGRS
ncbi:MAG: hypothetical protein AMS19_13775 [Gemmatimonas sp. SG8_23]|nr:MAG: hypothetical protein AMS19_13775 [Gemmatimonas sp. SG8_23]